MTDKPCRLSETEVRALVVRWREHGDRQARNELFERFLPLARRLAARYRNPTEPLEDLVQVAALGLLGAIDRFDPDRGPGFVGFAVPTILGELKRHFRNTGWAVHVPRGSQELALRIESASRQLAAHSGRSPRVDELAQFLELELDDVLAGLEAGSAHYATSLDAPPPGAESDEVNTLGDMLGAGDEHIGLVETKLALSAALARLPHRERRALALRTDRQLKQSEIARELGCSQMQVSRLLRRAAARIQQMTEPETVTPA